MTKLLVLLLARSYKPGGRCIAGKIAEYTDDKKVRLGTWVRPVPNDNTCKGSLVKSMYQYESGEDAQILDIVEIPILSNCPISGQPENVIIDQSIPWKKIGSLNPNNIRNIVDNPESIWLEPDVPTNIITQKHDEGGHVSQSLFLIQPTNFIITLSNDYNEYDLEYKRKMVAQFDYAGVRYEGLSVTCPSTKKILTNKYPTDGADAIAMPLRKNDNYNLCVSLGPRFGNENNHYKLVATVFDYDGYLQREYAV